MSPTREIALVVQRELVRNLRSAKGIVLSLLCVLGGVGMTLVMVSSRQYYKEFNDADVRLLREQGLTAAYGKEIGKYLADAPEVMLAMAAVTVALSAILATLVGFDSISSEIQHRGVRYWTVRARRASYVAGKFLGLFAVASTMTFLMHASSWLAIMVRSDMPLPVVFGWGLRLWVTTLPISIAWCAVVTFYSSMFRTPILALLVSVFMWIGLGLTYLYATIDKKEALTWIYPNGYDRLLLSPSSNHWLAGVGAGAAFAAVFVAATVVLFQQRDV